jgi:hypothetical protein
MKNTARFLNLTFEQDYFNEKKYHYIHLGFIISLEFFPAWQEPHGSRQNHDASWSASLKDLTTASSGKTAEEALSVLKKKILILNSNLSKLIDVIN